jgi:hypothetical protein
MGSIFSGASFHCPTLIIVDHGCSNAAISPSVTKILLAFLSSSVPPYIVQDSPGSSFLPIQSSPDISIAYQTGRTDTYGISDRRGICENPPKHRRLLGPLNSIPPEFTLLAIAIAWHMKVSFSTTPPPFIYIRIDGLLETVEVVELYIERVKYCHWYGNVFACSH